MNGFFIGPKQADAFRFYVRMFVLSEKADLENARCGGGRLSAEARQLSRIYTLRNTIALLINVFGKVPKDFGVG